MPCVNKVIALFVRSLDAVITIADCKHGGNILIVCFTITFTLGLRGENTYRDISPKIKHSEKVEKGLLLFSISSGRF